MATAGGRIQPVTIPDLGSFAEVPVVEVFVKPGDMVARDASLVSLESDKASMDVPSTLAGRVVEVMVRAGDKVKAGDVVVTVEVSDAPAAPAAAATAAAVPAPAAGRSVASPPVAPSAPAAPPPPAPAPASAPPAPPVAAARSIDEAAFARAYASPAIRKLARELGVDLGKVRGSARGGRVTREDVQNFVKLSLSHAGAGAGARFALPEMPAIDFSAFGPVEQRPLSRIKKLTATNLHRAWLAVPHVTQFEDADITELEEFRKGQAEAVARRGFKLTLVSFLLKASAMALREFPQFASSLAPNGEELVLKKYCHIGVAVDTPEGLVVPVLRHVDKKGLVELAQELADVSQRARDRRLKPDDLQGGVFSISSLGGIGGTAFTPIVNSPEVAILGVSRARTQPVYRDGVFVPRLVLPLSLSYDHRVIDGAEGARFVVYLAKVLGDIRVLAL